VVDFLYQVGSAEGVSRGLGGGYRSKVGWGWSAGGIGGSLQTGREAGSI